MSNKNILKELEDVQRVYIKSKIKDMNQEEILDFIINLINEKNKYYIQYPSDYQFPDVKCRNFGFSKKDGMVCLDKPEE